MGIVWYALRAEFYASSVEKSIGGILLSASPFVRLTFNGQIYLEPSIVHMFSMKNSSDMYFSSNYPSF